MSPPPTAAGDQGGLPGRPSGPRGRRATRAAGVVCAVHAVALLAIAAYYVVELLRGEGSSSSAVAMSAVLIAGFAGLLGVLARVWHRGSTRAATPTLVWNVLLVPVVVSLYGAGDALLATGLLVLVSAGVGTALAALLTREEDVSGVGT